MFASRSLLVSSIALVLAACSSKTDDDDIGYEGQGGAYPGNTGGVGNPSDGGSTGNEDQTSTGSTASSNLGGNGNTSTRNNGTGNGSSTVGGNGSSGGSGAGGTTDDCKAQTETPEASPPIVEFQVDITSSMNNPYPPATGQSRWVQIQAALTSALTSLASNHPDWMVALSFFAKPIGNNTCYQPSQSVNFGGLAQNLAALNDAIGRTRPNGYTPTYAAWSFAFDQITTFGQNYPGSNKYIVLLTDGVPTVEADGCTVGPGNNGACPSNCISAASFQAQIDNIASLGVPNNVKTFFVAIPGAEDPQGADFDPLYMLSLASIAGGTADGCTPVKGVLQTNCNNPNGGTTCLASRGTYCCVDLTQASNLTQELDKAITTNIVSNFKPSCNFKVPQSHGATWVDIQHTRVEYTATPGGSVLQLTAASSNACADGDFYYDNPSSVTELLLCPAMCESVQANPQGALSVTFECSVIG